jgi:hypothetical protein
MDACEINPRNRLQIIACLNGKAAKVAQIP